MPEQDLSRAPATEAEHPSSVTDTEVFAVYGVEPEVQAYAMAKYSRSALSMKESLKEISGQKAEKFLNTFYFQYGHRSIADLAHVALAIERLSILAAIAVVDEQRWDGQERSTRYQDFKRSGYYTPELGGDGELLRLYRETVESLFSDYDFISQRICESLADQTPRPAEMKPEAYERTLRARAFDVSRYLLPLATNTSLGEIVNARTLEAQIAHLLSHTHAEVRRLAELMKRAAREPAYNASFEALEKLVQEVRRLDPELGERAERELLREIRVAPTLVKYAEPNTYEMETRRELRQAATEVMQGAEVEKAPTVDLLDDEPVEIELPATLLYAHCHYPYRQIRGAVEALGAGKRNELIQLGTRHRGRHDELLRELALGQKFRFDILMDIGAFRDLHRHRRCVQIMQDFTVAHGFQAPEELSAAGVYQRYAGAMQRAADTAQHLARSRLPEAEAASQYVIPLAYQKRTLFKMDFAQAVYISELRTGPGGHFSYRQVAYQMFEAVTRRHPALARYFRVTDVNQPVDLLQR